MNATLASLAVLTLLVSQLIAAPAGELHASGEVTVVPGATNTLALPVPGPPPRLLEPSAKALLGVAEVAVETARGHLPRLPERVPGIYPPGITGPGVRVLWPAPRDNGLALTNDNFTLTGRVPGTDFTAKATVRVLGDAPPPPRREIEPFPLNAVTLLSDTRGQPTPFQENRDKFLRGLAESNPDRFLFAFRNAYGQPQPSGAQPLGVWDAQTVKLRGHATGHYLTALSQAVQGTEHDPELRASLRTKLDYIVETLAALSRLSGTPTNTGTPFCADPAAVPPAPGRTAYDSDLSETGIRTDYWNWGRGYLSAYPPDQFILLEQGASYGERNDQVWAPYYTLHKILAGLLDAYELAGNRTALPVVMGMARWVQTRLHRLPAATRAAMWDRYIAGEYGGMNEVLTRLARLTGDRDFLETARLFDNPGFFFGDARHPGGLARNVDTLRGKHANQHIPQVLGALEIYRSTGDADYWRVAANFWEICTRSYTYSIGGVAGARKPDNAECFTAEPDSLFANGFSRVGQNETCATYNLLKLTRALFCFQPEPRYFDYYERALYNHILASVAEQDAGNTYHVPLNPGARKPFSNARMDGFTCCNGTALESHTKLQDSIYFHRADDRVLYVNLFIPSRLNWAARGVVLTQQTDFPFGNTTKLVVRGQGDFELQIRLPGWAARGTQARINGQVWEHTGQPGTFLSLRRSWRDGDTVELQMPLDFHLLPVMDQPHLASLFYGPVLLAAQEPESRDTWRSLSLKDADPGAAMSGNPRTLRFHADGVEFKPFFDTYGRHSVYLDVRPD